MARSSAVSARGGDGRHHGSGNGSDGFRSRCKEARETPRAIPAVTELKPGTAWTAAFLSCSRRCRPSPGESPTTTRLFLNVDDELGAGQPLGQLTVLQFQFADFIEEWIAFGFRAAPAGSQAPVALLAPVSEVRRVETLAAEQGSDRSRFPGQIRFDQNTPLVVSGELAAPRLVEHLGIGQRFGSARHCAACRLASLDRTPLRARRNQNAGRNRSTISLRFHECFLLRPLH